MMQSPTFVPPSGPLDANIVFVGEQPGVQEIRMSPRKPFIGPAGKELVDCMTANDLPRSECYFTNVIKDLDKPLAQYISFKKTGVTVTPAGQRYIDMLEEELAGLSANVIVAVGNVALYALTSRTGITKWRGSILDSTLLPGRKVIPIIHPATVIPPKNVYTNKFLIITDLARIIAEAEFPEVRDQEMRIVIKPSFSDIINFLVICRNKGELGHIIYLDIEVIGEINCISFAYDEHNVISIPFVDHQGDYMTPSQEIAVWKLIANIIEDPNIPICGQNTIFDLNFINRKFGIAPRGQIHCTMIAQKILYPDFPVGLDFITSVYTRLPYYKADGKQWMNTGGGTWNTWWNYNARDSIACAIALPKQLEDLNEQGNLETYYNKMEILNPLMFMMEKGIRVDTSGLLLERTKTDERINVIQQEIWDEVGYNINYNSPKQLMNYFYTEKKHKPYMKRGKNGWVPTTDELALKRLSRKGFVVASKLLEIRGLSKRLGTYLNIDKLSGDSRVRCQYKPHGTKTGRLSSSEDIFGEGLNQQNWPHDLLSYLVPDPGFIFYSLDLAQIENRIVAHVGRVLPMIEAFNNGIDLHSLTAGLVFNKPWQEVSSEEGSTSLGDGKHSERDWGKKCNHSLNYDFGYKAFALKFEMPERDAKWIVNRYHEIYPEVRNIYHHMVRHDLSKTRSLTNLFGRKRVFLERYGDQMFKDAYAHIPQSSVADKMDLQGLSFIYNNQHWFKELELLIQIHDSIGFQLPLSLPWSEHAKMLLRIHQSLATPLVWHDREFSVPVDLMIGLTLNKSDCIEIKHDDISTDPTKLALQLQAVYEEVSKDEE